MQVQDDQHDYHMLEACHPLEDNGHVKVCRNRGSSILVYGGATCESSPSKVQSRKVVNLEKMKIIIDDLKWIMHKEKV